jgi:hypothetical protein
MSYIFTLLCEQKNNGQQITYLASVIVACTFSVCCNHKIICFVIFLYQNLSCFQFFQMFLWQRHNSTLRTYCQSLQTFKAKLIVTISPPELREMHYSAFCHSSVNFSLWNLIYPSHYTLRIYTTQPWWAFYKFLQTDWLGCYNHWSANWFQSHLH